MPGAAVVEQFDMGEHLTALIRARAAAHERSQQTRIGGSEIGTPCDRKLALKLAEVPATPEQLERDDKWRATVGTATHTWLADMLEAENRRYAAEVKELAEAHDVAPGDCHEWCIDNFHRDRYLIELRLNVGTIDGDPVPSNLDVFDRLSHTVVDWKIVGPTALKTYKAAKYPGDQYAVQVQIYGRGLAQLGEQVDWVGCMILPSNGELKMAFYWETEYDVNVGKSAFTRARKLWATIKDADDNIFRTLPTVEDHCNHCPFFSPGSKEPLECPGDPSLLANAVDQFDGLVAPPGFTG